MFLVRHNTPQPVTAELDRFFDSMFRSLPWAQSFENGTCHACPPMNVWEDGTSFFIEAELPGFSLEDIDVTVHDNHITIQGERKSECVDGATCLRCERRNASFERSWDLPSDVDADNVAATLKNGVLLITLPKVKAAEARKIEIKNS